MDEKKKTQIDMGSGKILPVILKTAIPSMVSLFFDNLFYLVDTIFVSWLGTVSLAALSMAFPLFYIALSVSKSIAMGMMILVSNARGGGDKEKADKIILSALPLLLIIIIPLLILALPGPGKFILSLLGAKGDVLKESYEFAFWLILSFPFMGYFLICEYIFMSHGNTMTPMKGIVIGNIVNISLEYILLFKFGMGVEGSSIGTMTGWIVAAIFIRWQLSKKGMIIPAFSWKKYMLPFWKSITGLGIMTFLTMIVSPISLGIINFVLSDLTIAGVAAWNIMGRLELMVTLPLVGLSNALVPFIGFNYGKKDFARIKEGIKYSIFIGSAIIIPVMIVFLLLPEYILAIFKPSAEVMELGVYALVITSMAYIVAIFDYILFGTAQGVKILKYTMLIMVLRNFVFRIPLVLILSNFYGVKGVYISHAISMAVSGIVSLYLLRRILSKIQSQN